MKRWQKLSAVIYVSPYLYRKKLKRLKITNVAYPSMETIESDSFLVGLSHVPLNVNNAVNFVSSPQCGAISLFIGATRATESERDSRRLTHLDYEAYGDMAIQQMKEIIMQLTSDNSVCKCYVMHRLGTVPVGEASIMIACSSAHRKEAHETVMTILNNIKARVPIWKKINYASGCEWSDKSEAFWLKEK